MSLHKNTLERTRTGACRSAETVVNAVDLQIIGGLALKYHVALKWHDSVCLSGET